MLLLSHARLTPLWPHLPRIARLCASLSAETCPLSAPRTRSMCRLPTLNLAVCFRCIVHKEDWSAQPGGAFWRSSLHRRVNSTSASVLQTFAVADLRNRRVRLTGNDVRALVGGLPEDVEDLLR